MLLATFLVSPWAQRSEDARLIIQRAEASLQAGDTENALRQFQRASRLDPDSHDALNGMARALDARNEHEAAAEVLVQILALAERQRWTQVERRAALRNVAFALWKLDDIPAAMPRLSRLRAEDAGTLRTDMLLVLGSLLLGDLDTARFDFAQVHERYGSVEAVWRLGALVDSGVVPPCERRICESLLGLRSPRPTLAELDAELKRALASGCNPAVADLVLGESALQEGVVTLSEEAFARIPDGALAGLRDLGQARLALQLDDPTTALTELQAAANDPLASVEPLQFFKALALSLLERPSEAIREAERGLGVNPLSLRLQHLRAEVERQAGHPQAAIAAYTDVLELSPRHAPSLIALGTLLTQAGNRSTARQYLQRYLEVFPDGPDASLARQLLSAP